MAEAQATNDTAAPPGRAWLRWLFWLGFIIGPLAAAIGLLDVGAHMDGPRIGLEGNGAPNALPYIFALTAFGCGTGGLFARALSPEPRPPIIAGLLLGVVCFIGGALLARPLFRWKWEFDCNHNVARACWAMSELAPDSATKATLRDKACTLGDTRGCASASPDASASGAPSADAAPSASAAP